MLKRRFWTILIVTLWVILLPSIAHSLSYDEVREIAKETTVLIDGCGAGSGILYQKENNVYSVLTAKHVVENSQLTCLVITPDEARYSIESNSIQFLPNNVDLAIVRFSSNKGYQLAQFGNSQGVKIGTTIYVSGAPQPSAGIPTRKIFVTEGKILEFQEPQKGYQWIYSSLTRKGMSGGGVFNEEGKVIGIHGQGDDIAGDKLNLGIPIQTFLDAKLPIPQPSSSPSVSPKKVEVKQSPNQISVNESGEISQPNNWNWPKFLIFYSLRQSISPTIFLGIIVFWGWHKLKNITKVIVVVKILAVIALLHLIYFSIQNADFYFSRGSHYYNDNEYNLALAHYNRAIELEPSNAYLYKQRGDVYYIQKRYNLALSNYTTAIELDSKDNDYYQTRGNVYYIQKQYDLALADYDKAVELDSKDNDFFYNSSLYDSALEVCNEAIELDPNFAYAYYVRGLIYYHQNEYNLALADYTKVIELDPNYADAYYNRGNVYKNQEKYELALADYTKVIELDPNFADAYEMRGDIYYYDQKKYELALADYTKVIELDPNFANTYNNRGLVYYEQKQYELALADFNKAIELAPNNQIIQRNLEKLKQVMR